MHYKLDVNITIRFRLYKVIPCSVPSIIIRWCAENQLLKNIILVNQFIKYPPTVYILSSL